jgi:hypothetical protein
MVKQIFKIFSFSYLVLAVLSTSIRAQSCSRDEVGDWQNESEKIINISGYRPLNTDSTLKTMELSIVQNAKVTSAYAGLFQQHLQSHPQDASKFIWLSAAAFASFQVGQFMRHAYFSALKSKGLQSSFRPKVYEENPFRQIPLGETTLSAAQTINALIKGNLAVYRDLYWQHLSSMRCGMNKTVKILNRMFSNTKDLEEMIRVSHLKNGWRLISEGKGEEGNLVLLKVEQEKVLQRVVYDGALGAVGGRVFAKLAKSPIQDYRFHFPSFNDYCDLHDLTKNFSNFSSRWPWISESVKEMAFFFELQPEVVKTKHEFMIAESNFTEQ